MVLLTTAARQRGASRLTCRRQLISDVFSTNRLKLGTECLLLFFKVKYFPLAVIHVIKVIINTVKSVRNVPAVCTT